MITKSIQIIRSKSGIYIVTFRHAVFLIEVGTDGTIHQLAPETLDRDGVLRDGFWNLEMLVGFVGPLQRVGEEYIYEIRKTESRELVSSHGSENKSEAFGAAIGDFMGRLSDGEALEVTEHSIRMVACSKIVDL